MSKQPEALRLADLLEQIDGQHWQVQDSAAAELRRLHAENERYDAECFKLAKSWNDAERRCDALLEALQNLDANPELTSAWLQAHAAIAKADGQQ